MALLFLIGGLGMVFVEEWFFRGLLLRHLVRPLGPLVALVLTSAVFSVAHGTLTAWGARFIYGLVIGIIYLFSKSLWPAMAAHYATNATLLMLILLATR